MIVLDHLSAHAGGFVLRDVSMTLPAGAWGVVLGPAGAGKTTLLEAIAGVRRASAGKVLLRGDDVTSFVPERRRLGIVYQHSYLFPHLTVEQNVAYGVRESPRVRESAERFGVAQLATRVVGSLSGGERQLVALARALAPNPDILLLDEPFTALDPRRRSRVRTELRALQRERGMTVLHVTHDFVEAGMLGDLAIVLDGGTLVQSGAPAAVFRKPVSATLAEFLGAENVYSGRVVRVESASEVTATLQFSGEGIELLGLGDHPGGRGHAVMRGEDVVLSRERPKPSSARNVLDGRVIEVMPDGVLARITIAVGKTTLVAVVTSASATELQLAPDVDVTATIKATAVHLC